MTTKKVQKWNYDSEVQGKQESYFVVIAEESNT